MLFQTHIFFFPEDKKRNLPCGLFCVYTGMLSVKDEPKKEYKNTTKVLRKGIYLQIQVTPSKHLAGLKYPIILFWILPVI